jgi:hypothetical protein
MNTRNLPVSVLLVVIGAAAILFIGAFAHFDPTSSFHPAAAAPASPPSPAQVGPPAEAAVEPLPAHLTPGLTEIIKLAQAHVDESLILAYIKNSHQVFAATAREILYLSDLGLSQDVIGALVQTAPPASDLQPSPPMAAPPAPPTAPAPVPALASAEPPPAVVQPEADASASPFYNDLAAYGSWMQQPDYGLVWQPTVDTINPDWTPYVDAGQWLNSDSGWYWNSDYTWGWAAFHYGRWVNLPHRGWVWQPGNIWAPAWVAWRSSAPYIGWAPLPPGTSLNILAQLTYNGKPAGPNATLGLPASAYTFVNVSNLASRNLPRRAAPAPRVKALVQSSVVLDSYAIVNNRIFNGGANPETVAAARRRAVPQVTLRAVSSQDAAGLGLDRKTLTVYVPAAASPGASAAAPSAANTPRSQTAVEKLPGREPLMLAENDSAKAPAMPAASSDGEVSVQWPPLRYPSSASPQVLRPYHGGNLASSSSPSAPNPAPVRRDWPREFATTAVEHPATPAPRLEGFNPPSRQVEAPHFAVESHPAAAEPAHVAPPAPAPAASSSSSSKSGK